MLAMPLRTDCSIADDDTHESLEGLRFSLVGLLLGLIGAANVASAVLSLAMVG
jgi:hypothetical protein